MKDMRKQNMQPPKQSRESRFYQALLDAPLLKSGKEGFDNLRPLYIVMVCGFDLFGLKKYRYTFENFCKEFPGLSLGDECRKIVLNTKGENDEEEERSLIDFLHYIEQSSEENLPEGCDDRLKELHKKILHIKSSEEMEVTYMKPEERERLIKEEGRTEGRAEGRALSILELLEELGTLSENQKEKILQEEDVEKLRNWCKMAAKAESLKEFCEKAGL